jgi:uncharacterized protein YcgI (DUF1989 family)
MSIVEEFIIEGAGRGSIEFAAGESIKIINTEGSQVVDLWAFGQADTSECLSTEHTRSCLQKLIPAVGDTLYSNGRNPMLTIVEDTSPGIHDMLLSACDEQRYVLLGHAGYHKNCADNLRDAMKEAGYNLSEIPSPFNIFENVLIGADGALSIEPPVVKAGQSITLRAEQNIIAVMSCCPMDIALTNGPDLRSKPVRVQRLR